MKIIKIIKTYNSGTVSTVSSQASNNISLKKITIQIIMNNCQNSLTNLKKSLFSKYKNYSMYLRHKDMKKKHISQQIRVLNNDSN